MTLHPRAPHSPIIEVDKNTHVQHLRSRRAYVFRRTDHMCVASLKTRYFRREDGVWQREVGRGRSWDMLQTVHSHWKWPAANPRHNAPPGPRPRDYAKLPPFGTFRPGVLR